PAVLLLFPYTTRFRSIYALGATLHHLATKSDPRTEPPFTFDQRPPRNLNPKLSEGFERIILRALGYTPADRFPSAAAMAQALIEDRKSTRLNSSHVKT